MFETHTTADGNRMLVCQMEDQHLKNTIRMVFRTITEMNECAATQPAEKLTRQFYNLKTISQKNAANLSREAIQRLYPYLVEAYLRGFDDIGSEFRDLLGRTSALAGGGYRAQLLK